MQFALVGHVPPRDQQQFVLFSHQLGQLRPVITEVSQNHAAVNGVGQFRSRPAIIEIARCQHLIHNATVDVAQGMQLEAKEPASTALAKISALISEQSHSSVTNGFADRDGFGINQVKATAPQKTSRLKQSADDRREAMQACQPLLISAKLWEGGSKVLGDELIGLFERGDAEKTLHQADGDDFRISERGHGIGRTAPVGQAGVGFEEVINEAVDVSHLVYNGRQMGRPPSVEMWFAPSFYTLRSYGDPTFQLNTQVYLLSGDGQGSFAPAKRIELSGSVTVLVTGEVNRIDGLTDVVVGVVEKDGPRLMVFEGPQGALSSKPEEFDLPAQANALALGRFDDDHLMDIAAAAGHNLLIAKGRDRKLSLDMERQSEVPHAVINRQQFPFAITSMAAGDFVGDRCNELALLSDDASVRILQSEDAQRATSTASKSRCNKTTWRISSKAALPTRARLLHAARISTQPHDDLIAVDQTSKRLHVLMEDAQITKNDKALAVGATAPRRFAAAFDADDEPKAVLAMRLNTHARDGLVILQSGKVGPSVMLPKTTQTLLVTTTADSGPGSLRQAILDANNNPGPDTINFQIGTGIQTITPATFLPFIRDSVTIDGTTQPGFAGTPIIELNGGAAAFFTDGLAFVAPDSTLRGLVINRFGSAGVSFNIFGNNVVEGNFIGTSVTGTAALGNRIGVDIFNQSARNRVGGTTAAARNVISGNSGAVSIVFGGQNLMQGNFIGTDVTGTVPLLEELFGLLIEGVLVGGSGNTVGGTTVAARNIISGNALAILLQGSAGGNLIQGNFMGTDVTGNIAIGNVRGGVAVGSPNNIIGGTAPGAGNLISGNGSFSLGGGGIFITDFLSGTLVQGNLIGTKSDGVSPLGNFEDGISIQASNNTIGGTAPEAGNRIAFNGGSGVRVRSALSDRISGNSIFSNNALGIELAVFFGENGVTPNDPCDVDTGEANNLQNFPVLDSVSGLAGLTTIRGRLNSTPNTAFTIEFFSSDVCDPSGFGEGQTFIGSTTVVTDSACNASFAVSLPATGLSGRFITATATDPSGNTSEFSQCIQGPAFDICLQDDSSRDILRINSTTGEYQFIGCISGLMLSGTGRLTSGGGIITLQHSLSDRRLLARLDIARNRGTASIQIFSLGRTITITDRDTSNNSCACF
jgi:hypothetical protein